MKSFISDERLKDVLEIYISDIRNNNKIAKTIMQNTMRSVLKMTF